MNSHSIFSLRGKKILVTGAAGHLGRAICGYLLSDGASVFAADINQMGLEKLRDDLDASGGELHLFEVDLADELARIELAREVSGQTDRLDGAVFAAAFVGTSELDGWAVGFTEQTLSAWRIALEVNLTAPFHLVQLFEKLLRSGSQPSVVNVGSIYGSVAPDWTLYKNTKMANPAAYGASKGGLVQLTKWLASALAPAIRVNIVEPGGILRGQDQRFVKRYSDLTPAGRMATEQDLIGQVVFLLSGASEYVTGAVARVHGGHRGF